MGEKLTKADVAKIQEEIDHRKLDLRPELIAAVKEARAQGDLSENFEYYAAKREKNRNESRIGYLERMLKYATTRAGITAMGPQIWVICDPFYRFFSFIQAEQAVACTRWILMSPTRKRHIC